MPVHAIEMRYRTKEMYALFEESYKLQKWLDVEVALMKAHSELGTIPDKAYDEAKEKGNLEFVKLERMKEIEREIHHDTMAMVKAFAEVCEGEVGNYIHLGATSYDIVDTAWALILKDAISLIRKRLKNLTKILIDKAYELRKLVCMGRTHGQHAIPTTYGMKFANWADEMHRHLFRTLVLLKIDVVGKFGGAVGTFASYGNDGLTIQEIVMKELGLKSNDISTQIVHRDRHAEIIFLNGLIATTISKIAKEIRDLQRNEVGEMFEPFAKKQVGSSTMASKRNPHKSERLCGVARILRSHITPMLEYNATVEHERDLTNSSVERMILPESFILLDFMLVQLTSIVKDIEINKKNIEKNLNLTKGAIMSEYLMMVMVERGYNRQEAHEFLREVAILARKKEVSYKIAIISHQNNTNQKVFDQKELDKLLEPKQYVGMAIELVEKIKNDIECNDLMFDEL